MLKINLNVVEKMYFPNIIDALSSKNTMPITNNLEKLSFNGLSEYESRYLLLELSKDSYENDSNSLQAVTNYCVLLSIWNRPEDSMKIIEEFEKSKVDGGIDKVETLYLKAISLYYSEEYEESYRCFSEAMLLSDELQYERGLEFSKYLAKSFEDIEDYVDAIFYLKFYIRYCRLKSEDTNIVEAKFKLVDFLLHEKEFKDSLSSLKELSVIEMVTMNKSYHIAFSEKMYITLKNLSRFEEALSYHETFMNLTLLSINDDKGVEGEVCNEVLSEKLSHTSDVLKDTLKKSHDMQNELLAKNQELLATMEDLSTTQEKLLVAEKHAVIDGIVINVSEHMNTPLGVMNTITSLVKNHTSKMKLKLESGKLSKHDLEKYLDEISRSSKLHEESMYKVINFIDAMKHYRVSDDDESLISLQVSQYLGKKRVYWGKTRGLDDVTINCNEDIHFEVKVSLLDKCLELIVDKILKETNRNGFDFEVSDQENILTIGIGDFNFLDDESEHRFESNTYDYYIIRTIVEDLMSGRFIKFEDRGREFYQFVFPKYL